MKKQTLELLLGGGLPKGDVLATARIAAINAAKQTAQLIPLCHPLRLTSINVRFTPMLPETLEIETDIQAIDRTGVEMEALIAAAIAALTVYDMCKAVEREMTIAEIALVEKSGGKSGDYQRDKKRT
jgi:cyclic pyranopterin phosphate synthase